jgi:putative phosphoesterase
MNRLTAVHEVDQILCAGDLVGRGPEQNKVVDTIRTQAIPTVRGNHDEWFSGLSPENSSYLKKLPLDWRGTFQGINLYMTHGKPGNNLWGLYRDHVSDTLLNMMLKSLRAEVLITGHTHVPMYIRVEQGCVVNPGSIYTFKNTRASSHSYGVLNLPQMTFDLYDVVTEPVK